MKPNHLLFFVGLLLPGACSLQEPPAPDPPQIIPQVVELQEEEGSFEISGKTLIGVQNESQKRVAALFFSHFEKVAGWTPEISVEGEGHIRLVYKKEIPEEGYVLHSTAEGVEINASGEAGFFYALQTLRQLLPVPFAAPEVQANTRWVIPAVSITDYPRFGWRGFMLDVSRHFFDKEQVKQVLDQMAVLKFNTFHWHLTDDQGWRIEIKKYPKLTEAGAWRVDYNDHNENHNRWWGRPTQQPGDKATYGGFYTQEDIREIIAYAEERFITIVPEIDFPGHARAAIASYPEVACRPGPYYVATGGVFRDNTLCPGKEVTFEFVEGILEEVMDLFPGDYIHIGGDECNKEAWKADPDCRRRIREEGLKDEAELQSYFIRRVEKMVNAGGKNLIGWDEILEGGLAPNATVMSWRGEQGGIEAARAGHQVIMTPSRYCYLDLKQGHTDFEPNFGYSQCLLSTCYRYDPVPESLTGQSEFILGIQGNLWSESFPEWDFATYMMYPRLFAVAENAWSPQNKEDWDDFITRLYPNLERLEHRKVRYANSAFNVWIDHKGTEEGIEISLHTEANGLEIKYTLDGSEPGMSSSTFVVPLVLKQTTLVRAAAFRNGEIAGKVTQKEFFVHKGAKATVVYHQPFLQRKSAGGDKALVDLQYGSNWSVDSLWQGFRQPEIEIDLLWETPQEVESVQMNFLQMAISGLYMAEHITILGAVDGKTFVPLGEGSLLEDSGIQGRYVKRAEITFPKTAVKAIKVRLKAVNPIPEGHHRQGELSTVYLDEIVVL